MLVSAWLDDVRESRETHRHIYSGFSREQGGRRNGSSQDSNFAAVVTSAGGYLQVTRKVHS